MLEVSFNQRLAFSLAVVAISWLGECGASLGLVLFSLSFMGLLRKQPIGFPFDVLSVGLPHIFEQCPTFSQKARVTLAARQFWPLPSSLSAPFLFL